MLDAYEIEKKVRPPAKPRFGSPCERMFGTTNTELIHNLAGNNQIMKNAREATKAVLPANLAEWNLRDLHALLSEFFFEDYDATRHSTLGQSPRAAFEAGLARTGSRPTRLIHYDKTFEIESLPSTPRGDALVIPLKGVKIHYLFYNYPVLRGFEGTRVPVRYDPWDIGIAHVYVRGKWVMCYSEKYAELRGRSEREIQFATQELRQQKTVGQRLSLFAGRLVDTLHHSDAAAEQHKKDQEAAEIRGKSRRRVQPEEIPSDAAEAEGAERVTAAPAAARPRKIYGGF
jgi:hypothetical protein